MNLEIKVIKDLSIVKKFLDYDITLAEESLADDEILQYRCGRWWPNKSLKYVGAYDKEDDLIAIMSFLPITNITIICHMLLSSELQGTGKSLPIGRAFEQWLKDNTVYYKLLIQTPEVCPHVLKYSLLLGFRIETSLTGSILWKDEIRNMIILTKYLDRSAA